MPRALTHIPVLTMIALPSGGGGLLVWNIDRAEILDRPVNELRQLFEVREPSYEAYRIGEMVVHSGLFVHQIAPMRDLQPDDERITFQGHSIWRATDGISIGDLRRGFRTSGHSLGAAFRPQRPLDREVFVMLHATLVAERSLAAKLPSRG